MSDDELSPFDPDDLSPEEREKFEAALNGPGSREHHYVFAHQALPMLIMSEPGDWIPVFAHPQAGREALNDFWDRVGSDFPEEERVSGLGLDCFQREFTLLEGMALIFTFPDPKQGVEAYFSALVLLPGKKRLFRKRAPATLRYLTLELGTDLDGAPRTVLGEWLFTEEGIRHSNYGDGSEAEVEAFATFVEKFLVEPHGPHGALDFAPDSEE